MLTYLCALIRHIRVSVTVNLTAIRIEKFVAYIPVGREISYQMPDGIARNIVINSSSKSNKGCTVLLASQNLT